MKPKTDKPEEEKSSMKATVPERNHRQDRKRPEGTQVKHHSEPTRISTTSQPAQKPRSTKKPSGLQNPMQPNSCHSNQPVETLRKEEPASSLAQHMRVTFPTIDFDSKTFLTF